MSKFHLAFGLLAPAVFFAGMGQWRVGVLYVGFILTWEAWKVTGP